MNIECNTGKSPSNHQNTEVNGKINIAANTNLMVSKLKFVQKFNVSLFIDLQTSVKF